MTHDKPSREELNTLENCEWIGFSYNSFELFYFYYFILYIFGLNYRGANPKGTYYDVVNIIFFKSPWIILNEKNIVDAKFCPGYCVYFHFGPWAYLWRVSNLGLEPCPCFFIESLSRFCISYLFGVYLAFNYYLSLNVMFVFVSYHVVFFVFIYVNFFYLFNYVS